MRPVVVVVMDPGSEFESGVLDGFEAIILRILPFFPCQRGAAFVELQRNLDRGAMFFRESTAETSFEGPLEPDAVRTAVGSREWEIRGFVMAGKKPSQDGSGDLSPAAVGCGHQTNHTTMNHSTSHTFRKFSFGSLGFLPLASLGSVLAR